VFVDATSGIGKATLTLPITLQTQIKVYVVGRNAVKQHTFTNQLRKSNNRADTDFLEGEVSLMAPVKKICNEIKAKPSGLYTVFLSTGYIPWGGSEDLTLFLKHAKKRLLSNSAF
jgi:hypothetical protein